MNFTTGELMMCIGAISFVICIVALVVTSSVFKKKRKNLARQIDNEMSEQQ